jgi:LEA14-like dessication related protein
LLPKADLTVTFEVTNPNKFDIVVSSVAFGLSEESVIFFPADSKTEEVWVDVPAGKTAQFEVTMTILKIPSLAAIAWPAIESGKAEWKARGTAVVISGEIPGGGLRQRFETGKVGTTVIEDEKK